MALLFLNMSISFCFCYMGGKVLQLAEGRDSYH